MWKFCMQMEQKSVNYSVFHSSSLNINMSHFIVVILYYGLYRRALFIYSYDATVNIYSAILYVSLIFIFVK